MDSSQLPTDEQILRRIKAMQIQNRHLLETIDHLLAEIRELKEILKEKE